MKNVKNTGKRDHSKRKWHLKWPRWRQNIFTSSLREKHKSFYAVNRRRQTKETTIIVNYETRFYQKLIHSQHQGNNLQITAVFEKYRFHFQKKLSWKRS